MSTPPPQKSGSILLTIIGESLAKAPTEPQFVSGAEQENQLNKEIRDLLTNHQRLNDTVAALFPDGVPTDLGFYARLLDLQRRLGWSDATHQAVGVLWAAAIRGLPPATGKSLLTIFPTAGNPDFFLMLGSLRVVFQEVTLEPESTVEFLTAIVKRIGNDGAGGPFWNSLGAYCEARMDAALEVLDLYRNTAGEFALPIAAYLLGALRSLPLGGRSQAVLIRLDTYFADALSTYGRAVYLQSWIETAARGKLNLGEMEALAVRVASAPVEEQEAAIAVFARMAWIPALDPNLVAFALNWLELNASPNVSPIAKHYIVDLAARLAATGRHDTGRLILLVQPIPTENKLTWARIENYLVSTLNTDPIFFNSFCVKLADRNAHGWLKVMQQPRAFEWLLRAMRGTDVSALANALLFSRDVGCRKLGLFLFDELELDSLPGSLLSEIDERQLRLGFYEACRTVIHGEAIARFLVALIPRIEKAPEEVQKEFFDEVVLQAKNYSGQCRKQFGTRANEFPILKRALDVANAYFEQLTQTRKSPIGQMDVPGYLQAARLYARRFSATVSKGAEEASVFMTLFKKVQLLYGRSWSSYDGGALSQSSDLKAMSTSVEIPRLENIDPEGMALHRLEISTSIASLGGAGTGAQLPK